jgi:monofunctional biosynthetic peptidoglycan transglycosylase
MTAAAVGRQLLNAGAVVFGCLAYSYLMLPDVRPLVRTNPSTTAFIELRAREAVDHGRIPRREHKWIAYGKISSHLKRAVLVAEDAAFWQHEGVDYDELQKSIEDGWSRGRFRGASTITQQLAKNLYLSPQRSPTRKLRELVIARRLEAELKKARILELYLNVIEWGDGIYGAEAASRAYYGVSASAVGPSEAAMLAAVIVNPRGLHATRPGPWLLARQQTILQRMGFESPPDEATETAPAPKAQDQPDISPDGQRPSTSSEDHRTSRNDHQGER